jgi:hypothetical protein
MPIASHLNGGGNNNNNNNNHHHHNHRGGQQPRRTSKFPGLRGFVQLNGSNSEIPLDYELGQQFPYAKVGSIFHIDHPDDKEIDDRIVVIVRTNNDSWSCYGFCRNKDRDECDNQNFQAEHAQAVSEATAQANSADGVPRVTLKIRDAWDNTLEVDSGVWINCRQILDIKHTVRVASIGSISANSLLGLLGKGSRVFNSTFADLDKKPNANTQSAPLVTSNQHPAEGTSTPPGTAGSRTQKTPLTAAGTALQTRPPINRTTGSSSRLPPVPVPALTPAPTTPVVRQRGGSGKPEPKPKPKLSRLDKAALKFMIYTQT